MKFCDFSLQGDVTFPEDFFEQHRGPWLEYPNQVFADPVKRGQVFNEVLDQLEFSSRAGIDGVCVNEHHSSLYALSPCPNLYGSALTRSTSDTAILVLGNSIPSRGNPVRLAEEYAFIDCLSGGRLVAGFPVGTAMDVNFAGGIVPSTTRGRWFEGMDLIKQAWTRPGPFPFNGRFYKYSFVNPDPLPMQKPHPPTWCLGTESVDTWEFAADNDYCYGFFSFMGGDFAAAGLQGYWDTVEARGRDLNPYRVAFLQMVAVSETDASAEEEYADDLFFMFDRYLLTSSYFATVPGYRPERTLNRTYKGVSGVERLHQAREAIKPNPSLSRSERWKHMIDSNVVVAGSAATVTDKLREMVPRLNIGHLMILFRFGSMSHHKALESIARFSEDVMPNLRDLHNDWDDHWWPQGASQKTDPTTARV